MNSVPSRNGGTLRIAAAVRCISAGSNGLWLSRDVRKPYAYQRTVAARNTSVAEKALECLLYEVAVNIQLLWKKLLVSKLFFC